ncbi:MAG: hypothetical protein HOK97_06200 [Deltaproteobacteria bacterium]|nr:hypothetical protein [Deltaproteobacteria bacterium]MBT6489332.1 hypothetical protein [Deltaproteobacteria bacterium]
MVDALLKTNVPWLLEGSVVVEFLEILSYGFSIWMFVDALRRKAEFYWFVIIIVLMPILVFSEAHYCPRR